MRLALRPLIGEAAERKVSFGIVRNGSDVGGELDVAVHSLELKIHHSRLKRLSYLWRVNRILKLSAWHLTIRVHCSLHRCNTRPSFRYIQNISGHVLAVSTATYTNSTKVMSHGFFIVSSSIFGVFGSGQS